MSLSLVPSLGSIPLSESIPLDTLEIVEEENSSDINEVTTADSSTISTTKATEKVELIENRIEDESGLIDGDASFVGETEEEKDQIEVPSDERMRFDKLNELLRKTETYSKFLSQQLLNTDQITSSQQSNQAINEDDEEVDDNDDDHLIDDNGDGNHDGSNEKNLNDSTNGTSNDGKRKQTRDKKKSTPQKRKRTTKAEKQRKSAKKLREAIGSAVEANRSNLKHKQPQLVSGGDLREYQLVGMNWLISLYENGVHGILADEMGLGKTIQSISLLAHLYEMGVKGPFLVVAPLSTLSNWMNEIHKWTPKLTCVMYHGTKEDRAMIRSKYFAKNSKHSVSIIITSYEMAMRDKKFLKRFTYKYIIVDEAHRLKNFNCRLVRELKQYESDNRLLLTGTPLQNNLSELWSLLNFLLPDVFDDLSSFQKWFDFSKAEQESDVISKEKQQLVSKLHSILRPFLLRRLKTDVEMQIPQKREYIIYTPMSKVQDEYYNAIKEKNFAPILKKYMDSNQNKQNLKTKNLLNILMQLRKVCNHPLLMHQFEQGDNSSEKKFEKEVVTFSGKFYIFDKILKELRERGHKVLVFSLMTRMLDIMEDYLNTKKIKYCRIDGTVGQIDRQQQIEQFNKDKDISVFLLSTRAGGLGINLTAADTVIIYDSDWNPQMDLQAMDRCHRIGQKNKVRVFRFITQNSVERKILQTASKKLKLERLIIHKGNFKGQFENGQKLTITTQNLLDILSEKPEDKTEECITEESLLKLLDRDKDLEVGTGFELVSFMNEKLSIN